MLDKSTWQPMVSKFIKTIYVFMLLLAYRFFLCSSIRAYAVLHRFSFVAALVLMRFCIAAPIYALLRDPRRPSCLYESKIAE